MSSPRVESRVSYSNVDKPMFPEIGVTKGDLLAYYEAVADVMLPHLRDRPLSLHRFPDGIASEGFYQKAASGHFPDWLRTVGVPQRSGEPDLEQVVCDDRDSLLYLANQACVEFHPWLSHADALEYPDRLVFDLDPAPGIEVAALRRVARTVRDRLASLDLAAFPLATGGKGFHVVAPLDGHDTYDLVRRLARDLAGRLAREEPELLTVEQRKEKRGDRIFLDTNRNAYGQTAIAPYSVRAREGATVATPLDWNELSRTTPHAHHLRNVAQRLAQKADPWRDIDAHAGSAANAAERM